MLRRNKRNHTSLRGRSIQEATIVVQAAIGVFQ
jgi:hypothetical protein